MAQPFLFTLIDKAVYDYNLIESGDRILVGASGGKDSTALIEYFANRKLRPSENFDFTALHVQSEFGGPIPENIKASFEKWKVDFKKIEIDIQGRLKSGKKMNCYWCSTQRRKELMDYAIKNGYNKIALGHHLDDVLETLLMNVLEKSELSTMVPKLDYKKYPVTIIRPMTYCCTDTIVEHAKLNGYFGWTCTCNFQDNSARKDARKKLEVLTDGDKIKKEHFFKALKNINKEYLP
ncbi:MAG: tRNA 2-thiocytidine biosynthesis TtcA family protein [Treponema sp.]|nr:tRNA 2-thiocytidine biosynthesis TtcA family protein [Spirochaetales bacterium]MDY4902732.1 tRNA 2-thiocytidine biosynthesis TtcA family protein [Treponema sp.]